MREETFPHVINHHFTADPNGSSRPSANDVAGGTMSRASSDSCDSLDAWRLESQEGFAYDPIQFHIFTMLAVSVTFEKRVGGLPGASSDRMLTC